MWVFVFLWCISRFIKGSCDICGQCSSFVYKLTHRVQSCFDPSMRLAYRTTTIMVFNIPVIWCVGWSPCEKGKEISDTVFPSLDSIKRQATWQLLIKEITFLNTSFSCLAACSYLLHFRLVNVKKERSGCTVTHHHPSLGVGMEN